MEPTLLVSLKKENNLLTAFGLSALAVAIASTSFNFFALTDSLNHEFILTLVIFFIILISARIYFVHTVLISQLGLIYVSNKKEKVVLWKDIGSVEVLGQKSYPRYKRLILRNTNGKLMRAFPSEMLKVDVYQAAALIQNHLQ